MESFGFLRMPLSRNGFTMPIHITFLVLKFSTHVLLTLITNWLIELYARSTLSIMANCSCTTLQQSSTRASWNKLQLRKNSPVRYFCVKFVCDNIFSSLMNKKHYSFIHCCKSLVHSIFSCHTSDEKFLASNFSQTMVLNLTVLKLCQWKLVSLLLY